MSEQFHPSENVDTAALAAERTAALDATQVERADLQSEISPEQLRSAELVAFLSENYPECAEVDLAAAACLEREGMMRNVSPSFDITTNSAVLGMVVNEFAKVTERVAVDAESVAEYETALVALDNSNSLVAEAIATNSQRNPNNPLPIVAEQTANDLLAPVEVSRANLATIKADDNHGRERNTVVQVRLAARPGEERIQTISYQTANAQARTESLRVEENKERLAGADKLQNDYDELRGQGFTKKAALQNLLETSDNPEHKERLSNVLSSISVLENALPGKSEAVARFIENSNLDLGAANSAAVFADVFANMEASDEFTAEEVATLRAAVTGEVKSTTGTDINNALNEGAGKDEAGNTIPYTEDNPFEPRPNTKIYEEPGGERTVKINVGGDIIETRVSANILGNDMGKVINTMLVLEEAESMGLNNVFFQKGFNQLGGGAPIRIDYDDINDAQLVMTSFIGGGTGFNGDVMAENETARLKKNFQWLRKGEVSGDGGAEDHDSAKAMADLQELGILDAGGALDENKLASAGNFIQLNAGTSTSRFEQLKIHLDGQTAAPGAMV